MLTPLIEIANKTMGILGLGNTGMATAKIANAFGMKVIALTSKKQPYLPDWITAVSKEELFSSSDILSLHCPLNKETRHIVNRSTLALMKSSAILINCGRGDLINEEALANALRVRRLFAAGLDVLSQEPPVTTNPLLNLPNCFTTPHIAWSTLEARKRLIDTAAMNIKAFLCGVYLNRIV
jgi:glycerate dehydrogenase